MHVTSNNNITNENVLSVADLTLRARLKVKKMVLHNVLVGISVDGGQYTGSFSGSIHLK